MLALIYRDYICSKEKRKTLIKEERERILQQQKEINEKYAINFKKNEISSNKVPMELVVQKDKWYSKLLKFFKKIFYKTNK